MSTIALTRGAVALVDPTDVEALARHSWQLTSNGYAVRIVRYGPRSEGRKAAVLMHRQLMGLQPGDGLEVDHINGNKLDNRRGNLRIATRSENELNKPKRAGTSSRYKNVTWDARYQAWAAKVKRYGRTYNFGRYPTEEAAAEAVRAGVLLVPFEVP